MVRVFFILPIALCLILLPYTTLAFNFRTITSVFKAQAQAQSINPEIEKACANALDRGHCITTLHALPQSKNANIKDLAFLSLNLTKAQAQMNMDFINEKLNDPTTGPEIKKGMTDCKEQYEDILEQIDKSVSAIEKPKLANDANIFLSSIGSNIDSCEEGLLAARTGIYGNKSLKEYVSSSLAVVNAVHKQKHM